MIPDPPSVTFTEPAPLVLCSCWITDEFVDMRDCPIHDSDEDES